MASTEVRNQYQSIYCEMRERNRRFIKEVGARFDPFLKYDLPDSRHGLSIITFFDQFKSAEFDEMHEQLIKQFPGNVIYGVMDPDNPMSAKLHTTFLQLFGITAENAQAQLDPFLPTVTEVLSEIRPFDISFEGIIATPGNMVMYGYPNIDLNGYRQKLREELNNKGLVFDEPNPPIDIVHATLVRFAQPEPAEKVLRFAEQYQNSHFGTLHVNKYSFERSGWRARDTKVLGEFELKN